MFIPRAARACVWYVALGWLGCGADDQPPPELLDDVRVLQEVVQRDSAPEILDAVDRMSADRPVHAARLLRGSGIAAARRQLEAVTAVTVATPRGATLRRTLLRGYRQRLEALERYADTLEGGAQAPPEDLLDAIRARRDAEERLLAAMHEMTEIVPLTAPPNPGSGGGPELEPGATEGLEESPGR